MSRYALDHLSDQTLLRALASMLAQERTATADVLAHIAEVDARKLYLPAAYPSMYAYCVGALHLSEEAAFKRIHAARAARRFPAVFEAVAEGRLHLSGVVLLALHLREETAEELLAAATHRTKAEIERLLAARFPRPDLLAWVGVAPASAAPRSLDLHAPGRVEDTFSSDGVAAQHAPGHVAPRSHLQPLSPQSFAVQFTLSRSAHEKLRYAQALLGHQVPAGDIAVVFERALDALIPQLEKKQFAATTRPSVGPGRATTSPRHLPAQVKRAVWARDGGRCTFVSEAGQRCPARTRLEFDHALEVSRGGEATVSGLRLRCGPAERRPGLPARAAPRPMPNRAKAHNGRCAVGRPARRAALIRDLRAFVGPGRSILRTSP